MKFEEDLVLFGPYELFSVVAHITYDSDVGIHVDIHVKYGESLVRRLDKMLSKDAYEPGTYLAVLRDHFSKFQQYFDINREEHFPWLKDQDPSDRTLWNDIDYCVYEWLQRIEMNPNITEY